MAFQNGKKPTQNSAPGAKIADPTRASRPHPETYRAPRLDRGSIIPNPRLTENGVPLAATGYGRNQGTLPSSIDVKQSGGYKGQGLSDFNIAPPDGDEVLALIAGQGWGDRSEDGSPIASQLRKISDEGYPDAFGQESNRARQASSRNEPKVPSVLDDSEPSQ